MTKRRISLIGIVAICFFLASFHDGGKVIQDKRVDGLVAKHKQINKKGEGFSGYRIQIFFDSGNNSRAKAISIKGEFDKMYKNIPSYLIFQSPNFKVRVGDFRSRIEAEVFAQQTKIFFPLTTVVNDAIQFPRLKDENIKKENNNQED